MLSVGCGLTPSPPICDDATQRCACADERRLGDGSCCPPWTYARGGACEARAWMLVEDGLGVTAVAPDVAMGDGGAVLVWLEVSQTPALSVVTAEEPGWRVRSPSVSFVGAAVAPRVAVGRQGEAIVTWRHVLDEGSYVFRATRDQAGRWLDPVDAGDAASFLPNAYEPVAVIAGDGELIHVWNQWDERGLGIAHERRLPDSNTFMRPAGASDVLSPPVNFSNYPQVTVNTSGDALISWFQATDDQLMTFVSERLGVNGGFTRPNADDYISPIGAPVGNPAPAIADDGRAAVAWQQEDGTGTMALYLAERDASGTWATPTSLSDSFTSPADFVANVRASFVRGHLYLIWQQRDGDDSAVYLAHRAPSGEWLASGSMPLQMSQHGAFSPQLVTGRDGGVIAAWTEDADGEHQVVSRRSAVDAPGASEVERWTTAEVLSPPGFAGNATIALGTPWDRGIAAWEQGGQIFVATLE